MSLTLAARSCSRASERRLARTARRSTRAPSPSSLAPRRCKLASRVNTSPQAASLCAALASKLRRVDSHRHRSHCANMPTCR